MIFFLTYYIYYELVLYINKKQKNKNILVEYFKYSVIYIIFFRSRKGRWRLGIDQTKCFDGVLMNCHQSNYKLNAKLPLIVLYIM